MRASSRRAQNSSPFPASVRSPRVPPAGSSPAPPARVNRPRMAKPSSSSRASAMPMSAGGRPVAWARSVTVEGPRSPGGRGACRPRPRPGRAGPAGDGTGMVGRHGGVREQRLDGGAAFDRAPEQPGRPVDADRAAAPASSSNQPCHSASGRIAVSVISRSCSSSASRGSGRTWLATRSMASGSSRPSSRASTGRPRRSGTARLRRSSSGASSRKVNGRPFRISCASTDGSVVSRTTTVTRPDSIAPTSSAQAVDVHGLVQAVVQGLADQQMVGDLQRAGRDVFLAGGQGREHRGHQVVGFHPLDRRAGSSCRRASAARPATGSGSTASGPGTSVR